MGGSVDALPDVSTSYGSAHPFQQIFVVRNAHCPLTPGPSPVGRGGSGYNQRRRLKPFCEQGAKDGAHGGYCAAVIGGLTGYPAHSGSAIDVLRIH